MTHISKKFLDSSTEQKLKKELAKFFSGQTPQEVDNLFSHLLTQSEQIMLIKRLAIVIMLLEGQSTYAIYRTLKVSVSTVQEIKSKYSLGKYDFLVERYNDKKFNPKAFLKILEGLLNAGMPSLGRDRWKSLR